LLGRFRVVVDGDEIDGDRLGGRAAELVQLLAVADRRRLARDQVIEALWPHLEAEAGGANLRKAAHHARRALGDAEALALKGGQVELFPTRAVTTDVAEFEAAARRALDTEDVEGCDRAASSYAGELLPDARYTEWSLAPRQRLHALYVELLRATARWEQLVEAEPTDEPAHVELMRRELSAGSPAAAIRWFGRLRTALQRQLGVAPGAEAAALYEECVAGLGDEQPEIVGRQLELARISAALRPEAGVDMLAIRGSAGIGKSALTRELERLASGERWLVVTAAATESGGAYAPLTAAIEQLLQRDPELTQAVGGPARAVLAELTSLAGPDVPLEGPLSRHRVIGALRRLLLAAAAGRPVVLVLDDAHLADEATMDGLGHLGSIAGARRIVVVLAYRPESAPVTLNRIAARLIRAGRAEVIDIEPLAADEARALLDAVAPAPRDPAVAERIIDLAEGNPYLLIELARSAVAGVPALVRTAGDAVAARFLDLDERPKAMLQRLALAGGELDPDDVAVLADLDEAEAFAMLDIGLRAGVLVVDGSRYRFRHELVRQALVEQLPPHRRIGIHRETAQRLAQAGAPPALVAARWLDGERPDEAVEWLLAAAHEAFRLGAFADAEHSLEPLLDHDPDNPEALRIRAEAMDARGEEGAPDAYAAAARVADGPLAHELRAKRAVAMIKRGDPHGGLETLEGVEPTTLDGRVAHALAHAGAAVLGAADPAMGTEMAAQARRLALAAGDPGAVTVASWAHSAAAHARGELPESLRADLTETPDMGRLAVSLFDGQLCTAQRLLYGARPYPDVIAFTDQLEAEADRLEAARGRAFAVTLRGEAKLLSGRLDEADADLAAGAELHRALGAAAGEAFAMQRRAEVALSRGDDDAALTLLEEALAVARDSDVGFHLLDRIYGTRVTAAADPDAGLAVLEEAEAAVRGPIETCPTCRITLAVPAAIAAARAGQLEHADQWGAIVEYLVQVVMRLPAWDAAYEEFKGHRARAAGEEASARARFDAASAGFARSGQPLDEARCAALALESR
jgi:DNA-binding SARP family transcriptional activator